MMVSSEISGADELAVSVLPTDASISGTLPTDVSISDADELAVARMVRFVCCSASVLETPWMLMLKPTRLLLSAGAAVILPVSPLYWVVLRPSILTDAPT